MKNEKKLNDEILKLTLLINERHPELLKYINEMPITLPDTDHPKINIKKLSDYKESLKNLIKRYAKDHHQQ